MTTSAHGRTIERRVSAVVVLYSALITNAKGKRVESLQTAKRGDLISLAPTEAARLDALGVLAPAGATIEDLERNSEVILERYRQARQTASGPAW